MLYLSRLFRMKSRGRQIYDLIRRCPLRMTWCLDPIGRIFPDSMGFTGRPINKSARVEILKTSVILGFFLFRLQLSYLSTDMRKSFNQNNQHKKLYKMDYISNFLKTFACFLVENSWYYPTILNIFALDLQFRFGETNSNIKFKTIVCTYICYILTNA